MAFEPLSPQVQAQLIELAYAAMIVRDLDGTILFWNARAEQVYGWSRAEALGQSTHRLLRTRFPVSLAAQETGLLETGHWAGELIHTCRDGKEIVVSSQQTLQRDEAGVPRRVLEVNVDVTREKQAFAEITRLNAGLEERVTTRTQELTAALAERDAEIVQRALAEAQLEAAYEAVSNQAQELELQAEELRVQNEELAAAQQALREAELKYRTVADFTWDWEFWLDDAGRFVYVSPSCERISGYSPADFTASPDLFLQTVHPDDQALIAAAIERGRAGETGTEHDYRLIRQDGTMCWASLTFQPVPGAGGKWFGLRGSVRDITRRKHAEQRNAAQAQEIQAILAAIPVPVMTYDVAGRPIKANLAALEVYGFDPVAFEDHLNARLEIAGRLKIRHANGSRVAPWDLPTSRALAGETVGGERFLLTNAAGAEQIVISSAAPIYTGDTITGCVATWRDITEREHLLVQLEDERRALQTILDSAPVAIVVSDAQARVLGTNALADRLYARPVPYGENYSRHAALRLCYPDGTPYPPRDLPLTRAALDGEAAERVEMAIVWPDGQRRDLLVSSAPIRDAEGKITGAVGAFEDITDMKEAQRERERLLKQLQQQTEQLQVQAEELEVQAEELAAHNEELDQHVRERTAGLARANRMLQALRDLDRAILAAQSPDDVARSGLNHLRQALSCQRGDVALFDFEARKVRWLGVEADFRSSVEAGDTSDLADYRLLGELTDGQPAAIADLAALGAATKIERALLEQGLRSQLSVPLISNSKLIGALNLWRNTPGRFSAEEFALVSQVADPLTIAIQHARLFAQVDDSRARLQALSRRLVEVQESERRAVALELHDESGQALTSLLIGLSLLERECQCGADPMPRIAELKRTTNAVMEELHRLAVRLRPSSLDRLGLVPALRQYADAVAEQNGLSIQVVDFGLERAESGDAPAPGEAEFDGQRLPAELETALYRITQEALTNIVRHAHAHHVGIVLQQHDGYVNLTVEDDGVGFDPEQEMNRGRLGLVGMRERTEMLGGTLAIESVPGHGTTLFVKAPLPA